MATGTRRITKAELKARQREAGYARRGPRVMPKSPKQTSDAGYKVREGYSGHRNVARNRGIVKAVKAAPKGKRTETIKRLAKQHNLAPKTVEHIARYFQTPEE